jgi:flavodoxin
LTMKLKKILLIAGTVVIVVVLAMFAAMSFIIFDLWSMTAGGSETFTSAGNVTGHALVVYNPGISGGAKGAADQIASDLKADGYTVTLAGVKSAVASDVSSYDVIVVGGPVYAGNASGSIKSYLQNLHPPATAKVGVFGFGSVKLESTDLATVLNNVASVSTGTLKIDAAIKLTGDGESKGCADFVTDLLQ